MTLPAPTLLLASRLGAHGERAREAPLPWAVAGLATGGRSARAKDWPCEDSVALAPLPEGALLALVADAHWGGRSSEVAAEALLGAWTNARARAPQARLVEALRRLDAALAARPEDGSETTVLVAHLAGRRLTWAGVGDSLLLAVSPAGARQLNRTAGLFLGLNPLAAHPAPPDAGAADLAPGEVALLATDGLEPEASGGLDGPALAGLLLGRRPLAAGVDALLEHQSIAGTDNLGVVALDVAGP